MYYADSKGGQMFAQIAEMKRQIEETKQRINNLSEGSNKIRGDAWLTKDQYKEVFEMGSKLKSLKIADEKRRETKMKDYGLVENWGISEDKSSALISAGLMQKILKRRSTQSRKCIEAYDTNSFGVGSPITKSALPSDHDSSVIAEPKTALVKSPYQQLLDDKLASE